MRLIEDELTRMLHEERPEIDPDFAAELDRWAAEGFPRADRPGAGDASPNPWERLRTYIAAKPPRRLLAPAGAALTLIVVAGVAISQSGTDGDGGGPIGIQPVPEQAQDAPEQSQEAPPAAAPTMDPGAGGQAAVAEAQSGRRASQDAAALSGSADPDTARPRRVAQTVDLVLASEPEDVRDVADGVNGVVNRYRGFVVSSSVQSGDPGRGLGAQFQLKVPARSLQAALADLSELAHVQSRTEGTRDITGRFISAQERIEENEAARASLLRRLENATTEAEIDAIRAQLRTVNAQLDAARRDLAEARQRVQLVPLTVSIVTEAGVDDDDNWGIGDAVDDAVEVLETTAGIALVAGAVLLPLALIGAILGIAYQLTRNRARERALDE